MNSLTALTITQYTGNGGDVVIPNVIQDIPVTGIGSKAFLNCYSLRNITIPDSVIAIGTEAFSGCSYLQSIKIPNNVIRIDQSAFKLCTSLTNVIFGNCVTSIGNDAFSVCSGLKHVVIPNSVTNIGDGPMYFGGGVFAACSGLTNVTIGTNVILIGYKSFWNCTSLTGITIPDSVVTIGSQAFESCTNITSAVIGNGVISMGYNAFSGCKSLINVVIGKGFTAYNTMGDPLPFSGCNSLMAITVDTNNTNFYSIDGVLYSRSSASVLQYPARKLGSFVIPNGIICIGYSAFSQCFGLTNITIPNSVTLIADKAFYSSGIQSINIPDSVTNIGTGAFSENHSLETAIIKNSNVSFVSTTFYNCYNLTSVYFEGNAPSRNPIGIFYGDDQVTVYYHAETTGWGATFADRPTAFWVDQPTYQEWALTVGLLDKYPTASAAADDADHDGMSNLAEMQAGTDPITANSKLTFESIPRPSDLTDGDKTAISSDKHALYFQTVPGKQYEIQSASTIDGTWQTETNVTATTTQKRVLVKKPANHGFYRVELMP